MLSRRRFARLALASTAIATAGAGAKLAYAENARANTLKVSTRVIEVNGKAARVYGLSQPDGSWDLYANKGERFRVRLVNELDTETLVLEQLHPPSGSLLRFHLGERCSRRGEQTAFSLGARPFLRGSSVSPSGPEPATGCPW